MNIQEFQVSVERETPPEGINRVLIALWEDAKGHWDTAHTIVQQMDSMEAMSVHAYLHREEGDLSNATYWYRQVNKTMPGISLDDEWHELATQLLKNNSST
jgi:hypothetical protein